MPFCTNCGAEAQGNFCPKCGAPLPAAAGPTVVPPPPLSEAARGGLTDNLAAALCYLLFIVTGIVFLLIEPYNHNRTIRFHAFQSIFLWIAIVIVYIVLGIFSASMMAIPGIGFLFSVVLHPALALAIFILWLALMYKAYNNQRWVLPVVGPMAEKQA